MEELSTIVYEKLDTLGWMIKRYQMSKGPARDASRGQGRVLAMLKIQPEIPTKELAYLLGVRQQSLNEVLNKLESAGLVVREPSEEDHRIMNVKLTEKGRQSKNPDKNYDDVMGCLSEEELNQLNRITDKLLVSFEKVVGNRDDFDIHHRMKGHMEEEPYERLMAMRPMPPRPPFRGPHPDFPPHGPGPDFPPHEPPHEWDDSEQPFCPEDKH